MNIFLKQMAEDAARNKSFRPRTTTTRTRRSRGRSGYGIESLDLANQEQLTSADTAIDGTDELLGERADSEVEDAGTAVAVEALRHTMASSLRSAFALEDLAEQLEGTLDGGGDGVDQMTAQMLSTAIEPSAGEDVIATESFGRNSRIATESMIDTIKDKAKNYYASVSSTITNVIQNTSQIIRSIIDGLRDTQKVMAEMKQKISILEEHAGTEITNEIQLKQLSKYFHGLDGDVNNAIITMANKQLPVAVQGANSLYEALNGLVSSFEAPDEKTISREAKRFFDQARKYADRLPKFAGVEVKFPEAFDLATLAAPETAKSSILPRYAITHETNPTFKVINEAIFAKFEDSINAVSETMKQLATVVSKKTHLVTDLIKGGMAKADMALAGKEEGEDSVQLRRATANVLLAANMICNDTSHVCRLMAITCEKGILMLVRASLRTATAASKAKPAESSDNGAFAT